MPRAETSKSRYVAGEVRDAGYRRLVDIIDPKVLNDTMDKAKAAV